MKLFYIIDILKFFIENEIININSVNIINATIFHNYEIDLEMFKYMLEKGFDYTILDDWGNSIFYFVSDDIEIFKLIDIDLTHKNLFDFGSFPKIKNYYNDNCYSNKKV